MCVCGVCVCVGGGAVGKNDREVNSGTTFYPICESPLSHVGTAAVEAHDHGVSVVARYCGTTKETHTCVSELFSTYLRK